jgi:hypothetical protein
MDLIFFGIMLFAIYLILTTVAPNPNAAGKIQDGKFMKVTVVKKCPPHRWKWIDLVDEKGVKQGEQLVCLDCGPLQSQSGRE